MAGGLTFRNSLDPDNITARTVAPGAGILAFTGLAPTLSINSSGLTPVTRAPGAGAIVLTGRAPTVSVATPGSGPAQGNIFNDGWELTPSVGCGLSILLDANNWDDFGPSSTCASVPPCAEVITSDKFSGSKCLRVHFKDGDGSNGPDFRIVKAFSPITRSYYRAYMKWDSNWLWSPGQDHKTMIWGPPPEQQLVYFNLRGRSGGTAAYVDIYSTTNDTHMTDPSSVVPRGEWVLFEMAVQWGAGGWVRAKINGLQCNLNTNEGGAGYNPENCNLGASAAFVKIDTTYNNFGYFEANVSGNSSNAYFDDIAISSIDWIGA